MVQCLRRASVLFLSRSPCKDVRKAPPNLSLVSLISLFSCVSAPERRGWSEVAGDAVDWANSTGRGRSEAGLWVLQIRMHAKDADVLCWGDA